MFRSKPTANPFFGRRVSIGEFPLGSAVPVFGLRESPVRSFVALRRPEQLFVFLVFHVGKVAHLLAHRNKNRLVLIGKRTTLS